MTQITDKQGHISPCMQMHSHATRQPARGLFRRFARFPSTIVTYKYHTSVVACASNNKSRGRRTECTTESQSVRSATRPELEEKQKRKITVTHVETTAIVNTCQIRSECHNMEKANTLLKDTRLQHVLFSRHTDKCDIINEFI